jgi:uncharacterized damage-inducible protein DinB
MINSLKGQMQNWMYGRDIIKDFITLLSDTEIDKLFPRKYLNSIRKQCVELIQIQECYLIAIENGKIRFNTQPVEDTSKRALLAKMDDLDDRMLRLLQKCDGSETVIWHGEQWNINQHISAMISHEQMHIGQIVAFFYATGMEVPEKIVNKMALDG